MSRYVSGKSTVEVKGKTLLLPYASASSQLLPDAFRRLGPCQKAKMFQWRSAGKKTKDRSSGIKKSIAQNTARDETTDQDKNKIRPVL